MQAKREHTAERRNAAESRPALKHKNGGNRTCTESAVILYLWVILPYKRRNCLRRIASYLRKPRLLMIAGSLALPLQIWKNAIILRTKQIRIPTT